MTRVANFVLAAAAFLEYNVNAFALQKNGSSSSKSKISGSTRLSVVNDKTKVRE